MSKTATLSITVSLSGDSLSAFTFAPTYSNTSAHGPRGPENLNLSAGFNSLAAPTDATTPPTMVLIVPSSSSTNTKTIKGITGDTGPAALAWTNQPALIPMGSAGAWGITSTGTETVTVIYF